MTTEITTVGQLMTEKLETIGISYSAQEASKKMRDKNVSSLIVIDNYNRPTGIVTERDLVRKVCVNDAISSNMLIKDIMSSPLTTIDAVCTVEVAADIMIQKKSETFACCRKWCYRQALRYNHSYRFCSLFKRKFES